MNVELKVAIIRQRLTQRAIASMADIPEGRLTLIVQGKAKATDEEAITLSALLRRPRHVLFPPDPPAADQSGVTS